MSWKLIILIILLMSGYLFAGGCLTNTQQLPSEDVTAVVPNQSPVEEPAPIVREQLPKEESVPIVPKQPSGDESEPAAIVNVDDVAADPGAYEGVIGIKGIVSFVYPSDSVFVIIDVKEYELCGVVTCAINEIEVSVPPNQYAGELPNVEDEVLVYGEIISEGNDYFLEISEVKRGRKTILEQT